MGVVKNLMVRAGADFSAIARETKKAQQTLKAFHSNLSSIMGKIKATLVGLGIGKLINDAKNVAMTNETSIQQINRSMNVHSKEFLQWANTQALAYGMAKSEATKYGAVYSNLISGFEGDTGKVAKYTQELLKSSAIVASGTGRTMEDVMERTRSGMLGNTEAIEDLGVYVNVAMIESTNAFKKFADGKSWQKLDYQTQQQIRLMAILEQTYKKYGDTINQNTATDQQKFIAQLKNAQLALGQAFLPIYQTILPALTNLASKLAYVMGIIAQFSQALFGKKQQTQTKATEQQASAVSSVGDAYQKAGKQAKSALAGFDEINTIGDKTGSGTEDTSAMGAAAGSNGPMSMDFSTNAPDISAKVQEMADKVKSIMSDLSTFMSQHKDIIVSAIAGIGAGFATFQIMSNWTSIVTAFKAALSAVGAVMSGISLPILAVAAAIAALVAGFIYFYKTNKSFRGVVDGILNSIKDAAVYLWQNVLVPFSKFLGELFIQAWNGVKIAAEWLWKNVLVPLGNFMLWFWENVINPIAAVLKDVLATAFRNVSDVAKSFWKNVLVPLGDFFKATFGPAVDAISAIFKYLWVNVLSPFATFLSAVLKLAFTALVSEIQFLWYNVMKPLVTFLGGVFKTTFENVFRTIGGVINGLKTTVTGILNFITGIFTGDWKRAWEGVRDIFKGIWESFKSIVKAPINAIIDMVNALIRGLNKISITVPEWMSKLTGVSGSFGFNIGEIPRLAKGGLAYSETMALIGDNPNASVDPEVISPLSKLEDMIVSAMQSTNANKGGPETLILKVGETELARVAIRAINNYQRQTGVSLLTV